MLGSGGYMPFPDAHLPAVYVRVEGSSYLLDAGEGTQTRLVEREKSRARIDGIMISHLHGDHVLGLPGVLIRISHEARREDPLTLVGPAELEGLVRDLFGSLCFEPAFPLRFLTPDDVEQTNFQRIELDTVPLDHRVPTAGFVLRPRREQRSFHPERARELEVPQGPLWGQLQRGQTVELADGRVIRPDQVSDPPKPGPTLAYLPDTRPLSTYPDSFRDLDLLVHDGMFAEQHQEQALAKKHSTAREAARVARRLNAKQLLLVHFSRRYDDLRPLLEQAREIHPDTELAHDGWTTTLSN